jgi:hypothetical protein
MQEKVEQDILVDVGFIVGGGELVVGLPPPRQEPLLPHVCPGLHTPHRFPMAQVVPGLSQQTALPA